MKIRISKLIILVVFVLIFLISYELVKGNLKLSLFNKNDKNTIFYCADDSYFLKNATCLKYVTSNPMLLGDVDSSGNIDLTDVDIIKDYLDQKKELTTAEIKSADINEDGIVDVDDISILQDNLNSSNNNIGKKYMCDDNYELDDNLCIHEIMEESREVKVKNGDLNKNNKLDLTDLKLLENYLNSKGYLTNLMIRIADYNNDDKIDKKDLDYLKSKKLKDIKVKKGKKYIVDKLKLDDYASIDISKNSKKKQIDTNTIIKYNFDVKTSKNLYYEWISYSDSKIYEKSMCNKLENNIRYIFDIKLNGNQNYYLMKIYEDEDCNKQVGEYKTEEFKVKSN